MQELIKKIEDLGIEKGYNLGMPELQVTKVLEECVELQQAIIKYKEYCFNEKGSRCQECSKYIECSKLNENYFLIDIKDAIGDIFIALVMLRAQHYDIHIPVKSENDLELAYEKDIWATIDIMNGVNDIQYQMICGGDAFIINKLIDDVVDKLITISSCYNLTLKECVEHAYNEIKDRNGRVVDGIWKKESEDK